MLAAFDGQEVSLAKVSLGRSFHLRGARVPTGLDLRAELTRAGGEVSELSASRDGRCEAFEVRGQTALPYTESPTEDRGRLLAPPGKLCERGHP